MSYIGNPIVSTDFPVDYKSGNGSTTAFTLSIAPASVNSIDVQISGVSQSPQTYSVSGTTLTFSAAPPTGTNNIVVRHLGIAGIPNTPSAASVVTASIADANVTQSKLASGVAGTGPAFYAYGNTVTTLSQNAFTTIICDAEVYDTNNCFNTTNYRFTPTVAGYYQINANASYAQYTGGTAANFVISIMKNGSEYQRGNGSGITATGSNFYISASSLVYCNGTTDYITAAGFSSASGTQLQTGSVATAMSGFLARAV